ncbi:hypothetical protein SFRURICE_014284 [Spodoptera frugiperda]|nr:hypothetical protein SFRURICE_014284 [Spodoptera frugiperda]
MERLCTLENEIKELRQKLKEKEDEMSKIRRELFGTSFTDAGTVQCGTLPKWAIERYSRQILLKDIGVHGQMKICQAKVLIVGAGGLGCPSAMYLAAAGVGEIGIIDYDVVEITNIHRQVLHFEQDENVSKAESAASTLRSINSRIKVTPYNLQLDSKNAMDIASQYDVILDCTDNVPTRYMLSDLSCFIKGSSYQGPCYRCVFPTPPSPDVVGSCSAHGVAGPVPGVIGILQAMEALKIILDMSPDKLLVERMLIFDAEDMTTRTVRLRKRNPSCATCSDNPTVTQLVDYEAYCSAPANDKKKHEARLRTERRIEEKIKRMTGQSYFGFRTHKEGTQKKWIQDVQKSERRLGPSCNSDFCARSNRRYCKKLTDMDRMEIFQKFWKLEWVEKKNYDLSLKILPQENRITASQVFELMGKGSPLVIDVRAGPEYQMCHVLNTDNRPIDGLRGSNLDQLVGQVEEIIFICRRGNDSQIAAKLVLDRLPEVHRSKVKDMTGGLHAWAAQVDNNFPVY